VDAPTDLRIPPVALYSLAGAMGRIVDVERALALHPGPAARKIRGSVGLDLSDPVFAQQSRPLDVTFAAKGISVEGGRAARERLWLSVDRLAQIYFGGASAETLRAQGSISGSARAAALIDEALAGPAPLLLRPTSSDSGAARGSTCHRMTHRTVMPCDATSQHVTIAAWRRRFAPRLASS
jgi:hypothetical protein